MLLQNMPNGLLLSYRSWFQPPARDLVFPLFKSVITPFITLLAMEPSPVGIVFRGHHERAGCPRRRREGAEAPSHNRELGLIDADGGRGQRSEIRRQTPRATRRGRKIGGRKMGRDGFDRREQRTQSSTAEAKRQNHGRTESSDRRRPEFGWRSFSKWRRRGRGRCK